MNYKETDNLLQWVGAAAIVAGHVLNTLGSTYHKDLWNIVAFSVGTVAFLTWAYRVRNKPQVVVNLVSTATCAIGLFKAFG